MHVHKNVLYSAVKSSNDGMLARSIHELCGRTHMLLCIAYRLRSETGYFLPLCYNFHVRGSHPGNATILMGIGPCPIHFIVSLLAFRLQFLNKLELS